MNRELSASFSFRGQSQVESLCPLLALFSHAAQSGLKPDHCVKNVMELTKCRTQISAALDIREVTHVASFGDEADPHSVHCG
jgi:hypothetical protein